VCSPSKHASTPGISGRRALAYAPLMRVILVLTLCACHTPEPAQPAAIGGCDRTWEPSTCLDAGHYYEQRGDLVRAGEMFHHACMRKSLDGCIAGAKHKRELAEPACDMGYAPACLQAAAYLDGDLAKSTAILDRTCERDPAQCGEAARIMIDRDEDAAVGFVRRACARPDRAACTTGVQLGFRHVAHREAVGRLGCAIDLAPSCLQAAGYVHGDDRRALLEHGCKLQSRPACEALGELLSKP
jgi:hypothetical protein